MSGSGISWAICKSAVRYRQITMPAPHHSVFYRPDALPAVQLTASKHWRHISWYEFRPADPIVCVWVRSATQVWSRTFVTSCQFIYSVSAVDWQRWSHNSEWFVNQQQHVQSRSWLEWNDWSDVWTSFSCQWPQVNQAWLVGVELNAPLDTI